MTAIGSRGKSAAWLGLLLLVLVTATGCVSETKAGDKTIFTLQMWVPLCVMLGGIIAAPSGWFLREWSGRVGFGLLILAPLACLFGVSLFSDRAEVDRTSYLIRVGIFGSATHSGKFEDLTEISYATRRGRRSTTRYMVCHKKSGDTDRIALGNAIAGPATTLIEQYAREKGVPIAQRPW